MALPNQKQILTIYKPTMREITLPLEVEQLFTNKPVLLKEIANPDGIRRREILEKVADIPHEDLLGKNPKELSTIRIRGLYALWWLGDWQELLKGNTRVELVTSRGVKDVTLIWGTAGIPGYCLEKNQFPLYIGKTTNLLQRLSQHLALKTENWYKPMKKVQLVAGKAEEQNIEPVEGRLYKRTNLSQFRSGVEHLFKGMDQNIIELIRENVGITFVPIAEREDVSRRFYYEDFAIGYYKPWFNVDSER